MFLLHSCCGTRTSQQELGKVYDCWYKGNCKKKMSIDLGEWWGEISRFLQEIEKISQNSKLSTCIWFHPSWWWIKSNCEMTSIWRTSGGRVFIYLNLFQPFVILLLSIFTFLFWDGLVVLCSCRVSLAFGSPLLCIPASCFAFNWICIEETIDVSPGNHFLLILNLLNEGTWGVQWFLSLLFYLMDELKNVIEGW